MDDTDEFGRKKRFCCMPSCEGERFDLVHKFPRSDKRLLEWVAIINIPALRGKSASEIRSKTFICTRHFRAEDYKHSQSRELNQTAVPCLNLKRLDSLDHVLERPFQPKPNEMPKTVPVPNPFVNYCVEKIDDVYKLQEHTEVQEPVAVQEPAEVVGSFIESKVVEEEDRDTSPTLPKLKRARFTPRKFQFSKYASLYSTEEVTKNQDSKHEKSFESPQTLQEQNNEDEEYICEYLEDTSPVKVVEEEMVATPDYLEVSDDRFPTKIKANFYWLRDHCRCGLCYDSSTAQRKFNFMDIPLTIRPKSYEIKENLKIIWEDLHESEYDLDFLYNSQYEVKRPLYQKSNAILWNGKQIQGSTYARVPLPDLICDDSAVTKILDSLVKYGLAFIEKVPPNTHSTEMAITRIFPVMKTFFGEMWTFTNIMDHNDFAYTTSFLPAHNDNTYFNDAAGLQILHCIHHEGTGGENLAVDGFKVIEELKIKHPDTFDRLVNKWQLPAEYVEPGRNHRYTAPVIKLDPISGRPEQLRFNMNDRAALDTVPLEEIQLFYTDMHRLAAEVQDKQNEWWFKLEPGTIWLFDNWRVLHGRNNYAGKRIMTGSYVLRSEFLSAARVAGVL